MNNIKVAADDIITVKFKVVNPVPDSQGDIECHAEGVDVAVWVKPEHILEVEQRPIGVGDYVVMKCGDGAVRGEVLFIEDQHSFVRWRHNGKSPWYSTMALSGLKRVAA